MCILPFPHWDSSTSSADTVQEVKGYSREKRDLGTAWGTPVASAMAVCHRWSLLSLGISVPAPVLRAQFA